ncbi:hypothetical protein [Roseimarinus sediminis]|uniref:hypothetical protein n=1 Tax=Roseimarinus sediminis TaxID=1610899 RepID=UPI003D1E0AF1
MKHTLKLSVFLALIFLAAISHAQLWVADTLVVSPVLPPSSDAGFRLSEVNDQREVAPTFLSVYEKKKWLFFPVDQLVVSEQALSRLLENAFSADSAELNAYRVNINSFHIGQLTGLGKRNLNLFASLEVFNASAGDTTLVGTFYYELPLIDKKKIPLDESYRKLLQQWGRNFNTDLMVVDKEIDVLTGNELYHFRRGKTATDKNFYTGVEVFAGLDFWGLDAELLFSEPEGSRIFNRSVHLMRYVNHTDFQAIAFGRNVRLWNYRLNERALFSHKLALLMGVNNWKNMETTAHGLEEILFFNLSFNQRIALNRFDRSGLVAGIGVMEDLHYIIGHRPKLKIALTLNCAYKF